MEVVGGSDARLSLSATDMNVQLELPGEVPEGSEGITAGDATKRVNAAQTRDEATTVEPRRIALTSVKKAGDGGNDCSGEERKQDAGNLSVRANVEHTTSGGMVTSTTVTTTTKVRASEPELATTVTTTKNKAEKECERVMRGIDDAMAMRKHLAATNPELDTAMSIIGSVCGRPIGRREKLCEVAPVRVSTSSIEVAMEVEVATAPPCEEKIPVKAPPARAVTSAETKKNDDRKMCRGGDVESDSDREEAAVVVLDDTDMSKGESTGEESRSRSSFWGSSSELGCSRMNRKRAAEDSPHRDYDPPARQTFPGVVSRGKSGCRVYVPTQETVEGEARGITISTGLKPVVASGASTATFAIRRVSANRNEPNKAGSSNKRRDRNNDSSNRRPNLRANVGQKCELEPARSGEHGVQCQHK